MVFAIPWEGLTVIGTTDVEQALDEPVRASADEIAYLCEAASAWFRRPIAPADVVHDWAGLRALAAEPGGRAQEASREYRLELDADGPALLSVFGGKLTTYRTLSGHALDKLAPHLPTMGAEWTGTRPLPGGDLEDVGALADTDPGAPSRAECGRRHADRARLWHPGVALAGGRPGP